MSKESSAIEKRLENLSAKLEASNARHESLQNELKELRETAGKAGEDVKEEFKNVRNESVVFLIVEILAFIAFIIEWKTMEEGATKNAVLALTVIILVVIFAHMVYLYRKSHKAVAKEVAPLTSDISFRKTK